MDLKTHPPSMFHSLTAGATQALNPVSVEISSVLQETEPSNRAFEADTELTEMHWWQA